MKIDRIRLIVQFFLFLFFVYGGLLSLSIGSAIPTMTCIYAKYRGGFCFLYPFQRYLSVPWGTLFTSSLIMFLIYMGTFCIWAFVFNKAWCGWACPLGFLQDVLTKIREALDIDVSRFRWITRYRFTSVKYILLVLLILIPMGIGNSFFGAPKLSSDLAVPFCQICPGKPLIPLFHGDFSAIKIDFSNVTKVVLTVLSMGIAGLFLAGSFLKRRFLCAYCPMAAMLSIFDKIGLVSLKKKGDKCTRCGNCLRACPMDIVEIAQEKEKVNLVTQDCILCMRCIEVCPENDALRATICGKTVFRSSALGFLKRQQAIASKLSSKDTEL